LEASQENKLSNEILEKLVLMLKTLKPFVEAFIYLLSTLPHLLRTFKTQITSQSSPNYFNQPPKLPFLQSSTSHHTRTTPSTPKEIENKWNVYGNKLINDSSHFFSEKHSEEKST
jgi:hypothetical protein